MRESSRAQNKWKQHWKLKTRDEEKESGGERWGEKESEIDEKEQQQNKYAAYKMNTNHLPGIRIKFEKIKVEKKIWN